MKNNLNIVKQINNSFSWIVVDDSINFIKDLTEGSYASIFDHPTLAFYKKMHDDYQMVVLLSLFYTVSYDATTKVTGWDLSSASDAHKAEFIANASWLKVGFHSFAFNVKYREGYSGVSPDGYDYDRVYNEDYDLLKIQADRVFGTQTWFADFNIPHFYDIRKSEAKVMRTKGLQGLISVSMNNFNRMEASYLTETQLYQLKKYKGIFDGETRLMHFFRDFTFERVRGTLKTNGTPDTNIEFLNNYWHYNMMFMNPETHEIQIEGDTGFGTFNAYSTRREIIDFCEWCSQRGIKGKFPHTSDFKIFFYK